MPEKKKLAVYWAAACGGCDVSLLDLETELLDLAEVADIVYWPVAMDFKRREFFDLPDGSVDFGLFNGAVRTAEQREEAEAFRRKCKVLVAYGSCACFGGIPGLANLFDRERIFETAYHATPSTDNPEGVEPRPESTSGGRSLTLPEFFDTVWSLPQIVPVDVFAPGCPPPLERVLDLAGVVARAAGDGELPPPGTFVAGDKALCDTCPRNGTRTGGRMAKIVRPHEAEADPERCFLDQGMICLGIATRSGCGATCIRANMPCRGCFGPVPELFDPAAEAMSAIGSIAGEANENDAPPHEMKKAVRSIPDPAGTFYRFTLASAFLNRAVADGPGKEKP